MRSGNKCIAGWCFIVTCIFCDGAISSPTAETAAPGTEEPDITMVVGEQMVLDAGEIASFSESTRGIITVKIPRDGRKLIITAERPGVTSLLLISRSGEETTHFIEVFMKRPEVILEELKALLGDVQGVTYRQVGPRVFIEGSVASEVALRQVEQLVRTYGGQAVSLVSVDQNVVTPTTNIRMDLVFVGLRKGTAHNVGVSWPGSIAASGVLSGSVDLVTGGLTASYNVADQVLPSLEMAARYGWARIRKRATVMTRSGSPASYEAGGEVNIAVAGSQAAELRTVPYGARLNVLPRLDDEGGSLNLEVEAEVSDLTESRQGVPGRVVSRVKTSVHLNLGQSILLGGLDSESEYKTTTGLPGLARIPILGLLFGSLDLRNEREEGLIIVTPSVLDNLDREGKRLLEEALNRFEKFKGKFK